MKVSRPATKSRSPAYCSFPALLIICAMIGMHAPPIRPPVLNAITSAMGGKLTQGEAVYTNLSPALPGNHHRTLAAFWPNAGISTSTTCPTGKMRKQRTLQPVSETSMTVTGTA